MATEALTVQQAEESDVPYIESLLQEHGLPTADVREKQAQFVVGYAGDERVCVGGLEVHRQAGLLRSVVVEQSVQGEGFGAALCDELEATAREEGVETLYLLTTTAAEFFAARGYTRIDRETAPEPIRQTTEFADLCPSTATCLRKSLA